MVDKSTIAIATVLIAGLASAAFAADSTTKSRHRHHHVAVVQPPQPAGPPPFVGGRLVMHPAQNIACNTRDVATRALPCDQPVWVYGSPCEIDEGLGFFRNCDEPPGVGRYDRWHNWHP